MTVAASRNKTLTGEFNLPTGDLRTPDANTVMNQIVKETDTSIADANTFLTENQDDIVSVKDKVIDATSRVATGVTGTVKDLSKFTPREMDKRIGDMIPNAQAQSVFNKMSASCKKKFSSEGLGKPFDPKISCNGGSTKAGKNGTCNSGEYGDVINKLTGGNYKSGYSDMNQALQNLVALSKYGLDAGMCGVFGALSSGMDTNVTSRAMGGLLGMMGLSSNTKGILDLAKSSPGLHPMLENPGAITGALDSFTIPDDIVDGEAGDFAERFDGGMELLDDGWDVSDYDDIPSIAESGEGTDDLADAYGMWAKNDVPDENSLDDIRVSPERLKALAFDSQRNNGPFTNDVTVFGGGTVDLGSPSSFSEDLVIFA